jgi:hypothetical protein
MESNGERKEADSLGRNLPAFGGRDGLGRGERAGADQLIRGERFGTVLSGNRGREFAEARGWIT